MDRNYYSLMTPTLFTAYRIVNSLNGLVYIGITTRTIRSRWYAHRKDARRGNPAALYEAMRRDGVNRFMIEEIACANELDAARELERSLIAQHRSHVDESGYNLTRGGEVASDEQRRRMADSHRGVSLSEATCEAISRGNKGKKKTPWSDEARASVGLSRRGKKRGPRPEALKRKLSEDRMGSGNPMYGRPSTRRRAVIVGEIGHSSIREAAVFSGVTQKTMCNWLKSGRARYAVVAQA